MGVAEHACQLTYQGQSPVGCQTIIRTSDDLIIIW